MNREEFILLFRKYLEGSCNRGEIRQLLDAMEAPELNSIASRLIEAQLSESSAGVGYSSPAAEKQLEARLKKIQDGLGFQGDAAGGKIIRFFHNRRAWWAAAILFIAVGAGIWMFIKTSMLNEQTALAVVQDFAPGHSGAVLHLSDGKTVVLDSSQNGTVAVQGQMKAIKINGALKYVGNTAANGEVLYNTVTTDRGREWQLTLPDGTKVWLNAASSITYPVAFTGKTREVTVTGEAYFEVVHDAKKPFRVVTGSQVIEDIGTSFDVNTYEDEPETKTTLIEGSVKVSNATQSVVLTPGQQSLNTNYPAKIRVVRNADIDEVIAWKNGLFKFDGEPIENVMKKIARWYDVDITYENNLTKEGFYGTISRSGNIKDILKMLELTGLVHFKMTDKGIVVEN